MNFMESAYVIPLGAFVVAIVAIISGSITQAHSRRIKADQHMALIARGVPLGEIDAFLNAGRGSEERPASSPAGRLASSRRAAMVLISVGIGVILLGAALTFILRDREVLCVCAAGLVPLAIGVGFLVDYALQQREMMRFGLLTGEPPIPR